ncbi:hypothetical protein Patl1_05459 [Pistacia atlantica]|uniref:Uncharacterized protein n=1 Tax=Pistacia atlantica TaxID=434234 RepID=A0ACC1BS62_9ROSI|nr:hypothetical protein Patl1_05459 [Pistacia atlantica]
MKFSDWDYCWRRIAALVPETEAGVESRLATLTLDAYDLKMYSDIFDHTNLPATFQLDKIMEIYNNMPVFYNMLSICRAILPATNLHCFAHAVACYYAALADGGAILPPHSSLSKPPLGSHPHIPKFPSQEKSKKPKGKKNKEVPAASKNNTNNKCKDASGDDNTRPINTGELNIELSVEYASVKDFEKPLIC